MLISNVTSRVSCVYIYIYIDTFLPSCLCACLDFSRARSPFNQQDEETLGGLAS